MNTKQFVTRLMRRSMFTKAFLTAILLAFLANDTLKAQTDITIGTGTDANGNTVYPCPLQDRYEGSRMQFLYRASELVAAGMNTGNISGIKFNVTALTSFAGSIEQLTIRLAHTSTASLSASTWETVSGAPLYGPSNYVPSIGINTLSFTNPFLWNGTDNIVVEICNGDPASSTGTTYSYNPSVTWTTGLSFNGSHSYRADNLNYACGIATTTNTGTQTTRPNIVFQYTPATPCSGTPNAGTVSANNSSVCLGTPVTLSAAGTSVASNLVYQWQVSTDNTNWNDIPGANILIYTTSQSITSYYRLKVTCTNSNMEATSLPVMVNSPALLGSNTYTIDKAVTNPALLYPNTLVFNSFNTAYDALKCGITGPVVFDVLANSGPYSEQLTINGAIPGASAVNTITFNGNGNTISYNTTNTQPAVIKLVGARHFIFDNLVITPLGTAYQFGFQLFNNADSNILRNADIRLSTSSTANTMAGIVISGSETNPISTGTTLCDYNKFQHNKITGGYYGITITATANNTGACFLNEFYGNDVKDFYAFGFYATGNNGSLVDSNYFSRPTRTSVTSFNGIYFTGNSERCQINRNRIFNPFGGNTALTFEFNGINFLSASAQSGTENFVVNNLVYNVNGNGVANGFSNSGSAFIYYMHNTIALDYAAATTNSTTRGFFQNTAAASVQLYNNIISVTRGGNGVKHCIYASNATSLIADYNDYYIGTGSTNNYLGYFQGNRKDLAAWQAASGLDQNSFSFIPIFSDPANGNYSPTQAAIDNRGYPVGVLVDINNNPRSTTKPDLGAYEFIPSGCVVPPTPGKVVLSQADVCAGTAINLRLVDNSWGLGMEFKWQMATDSAGPYDDFGDGRELPDTNFLATATGYYRMAITCGGVTAYSDTVFLNVRPKLPAGNYTINQYAAPSYVDGVAGGNFTSFAAAVAAMSCGIDGLGNVVMSVSAGSGPYEEQVIIDSIIGTSATAKVIFRGNGNTLSYASSDVNQKAVLKLTRASYIVFDSLTIDASSAVSQGFAVHLVNNADFNEFRKCTILASSTLLNTNQAGVVINGANNVGISTVAASCDNNLFTGNSISGGYYGVIISGAATNAGRNEGNQFIGNNIEDFYLYGFYLADGNYGTLLEKNNISRPTRVSVGSGNAIYMAGLGSSVKISKNRIFNLFGGNPTSSAGIFGIYMNNAAGESGNPHVIVNNLIYNLTGNGNIIAIQNTRSGFTDILHNTIVIDNQAATSSASARGFYQTTAATNIRFLNNIITITKTGAGFKHGLYFETSTSQIEANNNNIYVAGAGTANYFGYYNGNRVTLADWQAATGQSSKSFDLDPLFANAAAENFRPTIATIDNVGTPVGVATDIFDAPRSATRPDIGAIEFSVASCVTPSATTATATPNTNLCIGTPITLDIPGTVSYNALKFVWENGASATGPWTAISDSLDLPEFATGAFASPYYRAQIICGTNVFTSSVVTVTNNLLLNGGVYTINNTIPTNYTGVPGANFNSFKDAVTYMQCGITGPVLFNVAPGVNGEYNEQVTIGKIPGSSATSGVIFQAANGSASSVNITYTATRSDSNWVVLLNGASYVSFKNLSMTATGTGFGRVFEFGSQAAFDTLLNCHIVALPANTNSALLAAVVSTQVKGTGNLIRGNTIDRGSNGIYFTGTATSDLAPAGNKIEDNILNNPFSHGIYLQNTYRSQVTGNSVYLTSPVLSGTAGIYFNIADTGFRLMHNKVVIDSITGGVINGIYINNSKAVKLDSSIVASNMIEANRKNNGNVNGITLSNSKGIHVANNIIAINSAGTAAYGLYSLGANDLINYFNNSVNIRANSVNGYAGYFNSTITTSQVRIRNNIFSNEGGGRALWVNNTAYFSSDYNLLYTNGPVLVQVLSGTANQYATLPAWKSSTNWDRSSISIKPSFADTVTLRPNINDANSWAMQGRGIQVKGNTYDFDGKPRPDSLTGGVPDLGAYEFFPAVEPPVLPAIPATPAIGQTQAFMFGTDTVMKMTWNGPLPASVAVRRYSGVVPSDLGPRPDSMFFYTKVDVPNSNNVAYDVELFYIDSWQGSIDRQSRIGLGRTTPGNSWVVGFNSKVSTTRKNISQASLTYLNRFTGLLNTSIITSGDSDSTSNAGKNFWVGYQRTNGFDANGQQMVLYFGAGEQEANVTVEINGTSYVRNYTVPAFTAIASELLPKTGVDDARMVNEGQLNRGIHITSDVPIVAYAHIYESANSGATMLLPVGVWGYEYFTLSSRQYYSTGSYSAFHVVAQHDSTWVQITPSKNSRNGLLAGQTYLFKLNKGETYQVLGAQLSGSEGEDLTGSIVRSVPNNQGECFSIGVFAGSTRTGIGCGTSAGGSGDLIIQQIFPSQAWGTTYLLAATTNTTGPSASSNMVNKYRILVKDTATEVRRNGVLIPKASLINKRYYEIETALPDYIETTKPVLVAQFMSSSGSCTNTSGDGDPEMFYLSPLQQAIKHTYFYRNITQAINTNFITLVVPNDGLSTLQIDGVLYSSYPASEIYSYPHTYAGYTVVTKKWGKVAGASSVECESPFTGIVYGIGSVESYGYNVGTLVKNLNATSAIQNQFNSSGNPIEYTCVGAPFFARALLDLHPDSIYWHFSAVPGITPNRDTVTTFPSAYDTTSIDGVTFYSYQVNQSFRMMDPGIYAIPYDYWHSSIEGCDKKRSSTIYLQVLPKHPTNFSISLSGGRLEACEGETASFTGDEITQNGLSLTNWNWTINNGTGNPISATGRIQNNIPYNTAGTYNVILNSITADGCVSDTSKTVVVRPKPTVASIPSVSVCPGESAVLTISNPVAGTTYYWYTAATGGTPVDSGVSVTVANPAIGATYYAEAVSNSCISGTRSTTAINQLSKLASPTVTVSNVSTTEVSFQWTAVTGASGYELTVTTNGVAGTPVNVSSSTLTYTAGNLQPATTVILSVKALAIRDCQKSDAASASGSTRIDQLYIPNAFTPNGDGLNDRLYVYSYVVSSMQMSIFNQWGEKVFESTNMICTNNASCPGTGWDGRYKGKDLPMGVYMYVARFTLSTGATVEKKGAINLVR